MQQPSFKVPRAAEKLVAAMQELRLPGRVKLMEVCGTHTMAIAKAGIRSLLPKGVELISGPGCPVCVTPQGDIDAFLELSENPDVILTTYGDMIRVPGSRRGDDLRARRAKGADVRVVYSPMDAVELAIDTPEKQIVFLGVGFETTAPGTALAIEAAKEGGVKNFSVLPMLKTVEPALYALYNSPDFDISGLICPGHVATILGEVGFRYVPEKLNLPAVITGFEPLDVLTGIYMLLVQIAEGEPRLENEYTRAVLPEGNPVAREICARVFEPCDSAWRGLGIIPGSGLAIRGAYAEHDARRRFDIIDRCPPEPAGCCCGDIIRGKRAPRECPLFGRVCTPEDPVGPCMVSGEGACAAAWKYQGI